MSYTQEELERCLKSAWSYENREGHGKEKLNTWQIGTVKRENRLYDVYEDAEHNYWFLVRMIVDGKAVSEYEAIFGHPQRKAQQRKREF